MAHEPATALDPHGSEKAQRHPVRGHGPAGRNRRRRLLGPPPHSALEAGPPRSVAASIRHPHELEAGAAGAEAVSGEPLEGEDRESLELDRVAEEQEVELQRITGTVALRQAVGLEDERPDR